MNKTLKKILISLFVATAALCFCACESQNAKENGIYIAQLFDGEIRVQLGYDFEIPTEILGVSENVSVTDKGGEKMQIKGTSVFFDKIGEYVLHYDDNEISIVVMDTEKPTLRSIGNKFQDLVAATISYGEELDLDDVFIPVDNSGSATNEYRVFEMGNEVELTDGNVLCCNIKNPSYYEVEIYATDGSGNSARYSYRINVSKWYDPELGQRGITFVCGSEYKLGDFAITDVDLPDGTPVFVTTEIQMYGTLFTRDALWPPRDTI